MATELFDAIAAHDMVRLTEALAAGADANALAADAVAWRPLHAAVEELEHGGPLAALPLLLRHGAAVDGWDGRRQATPLLMALFRGQGDAARLLLEAGADPNVVGAEGDTPLRWCVEQGDCEMAALLLGAGAARSMDEAGGPSGVTALGRAASRIDVTMLKLLLAAGADPAALDADHLTARQRLSRTTGTDPAAWAAAAALLG